MIWPCIIAAPFTALLKKKKIEKKKKLKKKGGRGEGKISDQMVVEAPLPSSRREGRGKGEVAEILGGMRGGGYVSEQ